MVGFVIPFRPKSTSISWQIHSNYLLRTILSICNQLDSSFRIFVVYTDLPDFRFEHPLVTFLKFPYSFLSAREIEDYESHGKKWYSEKVAGYAMDQGRKVLFGCRAAKDYGCSYIMSVDADDLISNKIVSYIKSQKDETAPGWVITKGFMYVEDRNYIYKKRSRMNEINGSTHIIKAEIIPEPDFNSKRLSDFNFFAAHGWLFTRLRNDYKIDLIPLPFAGVVYSLNEQSWSSHAKKFEGSHLKRVLRLIISGRYLTNSIKKEFGLVQSSRI